jgi:type IV pilus assembly protein PilY1
VRFTSYADEDSTTVNVRIYGHDEDDADAPTSSSQVIDATLTTEYVDWSNIAAWTDGSQYDSPDITDIIQEIVDRVGWSSGNALVLQFRDNSSSSGAYRSLSMYDYDSGSEKAELHITYS